MTISIINLYQQLLPYFPFQHQYEHPFVISSSTSLITSCNYCPKKGGDGVGAWEGLLTVELPVTETLTSQQLVRGEGEKKSEKCNVTAFIQKYEF